MAKFIVPKEIFHGPVSLENLKRLKKTKSDYGLIEFDQFL
jgi:hypothetical protein